MPGCSEAAFSDLPGVRLTTVAHQEGPVSHCRVSGVIGTETNFELLLPDEWNGKFIMFGNGGLARPPHFTR